MGSSNPDGFDHYIGDSHRKHYEDNAAAFLATLSVNELIDLLQKRKFHVDVVLSVITTDEESGDVIQIGRGSQTGVQHPTALSDRSRDALAAFGDRRGGVETGV